MTENATGILDFGLGGDNASGEGEGGQEKVSGLMGAPGESSEDAPGAESNGKDAASPEASGAEGVDDIFGSSDEEFPEDDSDGQDGEKDPKWLTDRLQSQSRTNKGLKQEIESRESTIDELRAENAAMRQADVLAEFYPNVPAEHRREVAQKDIWFMNQVEQMREDPQAKALIQAVLAKNGGEMAAATQSTKSNAHDEGAGTPSATRVSLVDLVSEKALGGIRPELHRPLVAAAHGHFDSGQGAVTKEALRSFFREFITEQGWSKDFVTDASGGTRSVRPPTRGMGGGSPSPGRQESQASGKEAVKEVPEKKHQTAEDARQDRFSTMRQLLNEAGAGR